MNRTITVGHALLALATLSTVALAACGGTHGTDHSSTGQPTTSASPGATFNDADVAFAHNMIPHHQQAVEMATLAESRASDPEIKQLAATIKAAQAPEIATMTGWLTAWGQPTAAPSGHGMSGGHGGMSGMMSAEEMAQLNAASGVDFDRMFARMMIAHHNGAIQMARDEETNGTNPVAKALAAQIMKSQSAEVDQLQKVLDRL
jgi:uncharacterized protein (DUF305 family)